ncbi:membrane-targeted effector domain-containing toxin [Pseudomonas sp. DR208]|uniref:membrane-targeted effector domain-containing toxin n=1 Tax=Pseudomonas sp. DR208 TaxID=2870840 RepID=UPI001C9925B5|nr:membrane-targeted effector domain-containing toxin [Pseudomonas sp. DR208]QZP18658.1 membrane-targeted effector domain-containing toxin [Pseudomonas sp. DR208]
MTHLDTRSPQQSYTYQPPLPDGRSLSALHDTASANLDSAAGPTLLPQTGKSPDSGDFKQQLADQQNFRTLARKLTELAAQLGEAVTPQAVLAALKSTPMVVAPGSSSFEELGRTTLENYIAYNGLPLPDSHSSLIALASALVDSALEHPLGNFGGALSWPIPLSRDDQRRLRLIAMSHEHHLEEKPLVMQTKGGLLEFLRYQAPLPEGVLNDPIRVLETLIGSAQGQLMGKALQQKMNGVDTAESANDYLMAAMILQLDPEYFAEPAPNKVAGFDLSNKAHWGKPLSMIVDGLSTHLSESGRTSAEMAKTGAHLLLSKKTPELLIKDIPGTVVYGSAAWVRLSIAAASIEALTPGKVQNMTFNQVMAEADIAALSNRQDTQRAQIAALRVWGLVNGILSPERAGRYNDADIEVARSAFNQQATAQIEASSLIQSDMPSRRDIALARLKERFGENVPFEEWLLKVHDNKQPSIQPVYDPNRAPAGMMSLLDIAMSGLHNYEWVSQDPRINAALKGKSLDLGVNAEFNSQLVQAISDKKKGIGVAIKHMIAQLPLADRQNLEYGQLEFYQLDTYRLGPGFTGKTLDHKNEKLYVKATGANGTATYELDLSKHAITAVSNSVLTHEREREANRVYPIEKFTPVANADFSQNTKAGSPLPTPSNFTSTRTQAIADTFVKHLQIDSRDVIKQAKGATSFDNQMDAEWNLTNFFLDLIPFRSAIRNFQEGHYADGAIDLFMDVFSFVTAGAGAAAKATKVGSKAISLTKKALQVSKIVGTTVISEFNPLSGVGDLLLGGTRLASKGITKAKIAAGLTPPPYGDVTWGTLKVGEQTLETSSVIHNGQRYAYDPVTRRPYGPPLKDFNVLETLSPTVPQTHSPRQSSSRRRRPPSNTGARQVHVRKPLPKGDYVESLQGKFETDHFFQPDIKAKTLEKFKDEMNACYDALAETGLPPRPVIPSVPEPISAPELFAEAFKASNGIVLGESHKQMASFKVLFDNVETLKNQGVKKVYFEALIDTPDGLIDDGIGYLGDGRTLRTDPTFKELCEKLEANGIEVMPIDHIYLTRHKGDLHKAPTTTGERSQRRLKEFNYYASETIQATSGTEKWVALVGCSHMNTSENVPGLAELTGSIGIGVFNNKNVTGQIGTRVIGRPQDPTQPVGWGRGIPGDLQIYVEP